MSKVEQIEAEITKLPSQEVREVSRWLQEYEAELWDEEMERDAQPGGPLDKLAQQARQEIAAGKTQPLDEFLRHQ
ncbi:MAG: hypothetical protein FJ395_13830 [Verrucomicrobia bacterium]|nr:hypothetical protein [Verrucomicrobiota bacterium]